MSHQPEVLDRLDPLVCGRCGRLIAETEPYRSEPADAVYFRGDPDTFVYFHPRCHDKWLRWAETAVTE